MRNSIIVVRPGPRYPESAGFARMQPNAAAGLPARPRLRETDRDAVRTRKGATQMAIHCGRAARGLAFAAVIGTVAAPAASAVPAERFLPAARDDSSDRPVPVRVVQVGADEGFDWGDAGIGATGVIALAAIGAGAALATGHRPRARNNPQPIR
jgi:hypothetical protein